jgi:hypothetical protein
MASFIDNIPQFNPYISQMPLEQMAQVGMYKQQKYDEGVQKIQSYIDNVAGLDVVKPLHKQYLQSKLDELGSKLKTVAAGDFSNFQLVNSVGGMANQIAKDSTIQTAVASTQKFRKGQQDQETARKAGKSSPDNDWWWETGVQDWLTDGDLNSAFTGDYEEYIDVDGKLREIAEKVKEIDISVDNPFLRDNQGKTLYFKTDPKTRQTSVSTDPNSGGVTRIDMAMLRTKTKGKPAQKILDNFYSSLDEKEKRQLFITGNYNYRGATKETFKNDLQQTYSKNKKILEEQLSDLAAEIVTNSKLSTEQKQVKEAQLAQIKSALDNNVLEKKLQDELANIDAVKDIKDFKYKVYTQKYLTNLAQDLSYQSYQTEIMNNPYAQMDMEKQKLQFQVNRAQQEHNEFTMRLNFDKQKHSFDVYKWETEQEDKAREKLINTPITEAGPLTPGSFIAPTLNRLDSDIKQNQEALRILDSQYRNKMFPGMSGEGQDAAMKKAMSDYNQNPNLIRDNDVREWLERKRGLEIQLAQKNQLKLGALEATKRYDAEIAQKIKGYGGIVGSDGREILSAQQLYEFSANVPKYLKTSTATFGGAAPAKPFLNEAALMKDYKGTSLEGLAALYIKNFKGESLNKNDRIILDKMLKLKSIVSDDVRQSIDRKYEAQSKYLAEKMPEYQASFGTLNMEDKNIKSKVENLVGNKFYEYKKYGSLDLDERKQFNPTTVEALQKNPRTKYVLEKKYDGSGQLVMTDGTTTQIIPLNDYQFSQYFSEYAQRNPMTSIKSAIMASPNKTTNLSGQKGSAAAVNAYFSGYDVSGLAGTPIAPLVRVDVEGAASNNGGPSDKFQVRMYGYYNNDWVSGILNQNGYVGEDGVLAIMKNIGTNTYQDLLKQNNK